MLLQARVHNRIELAVAEKRSELERAAAVTADERDSALQSLRARVIEAEARAGRAEEAARAAQAQVRQAERRREEQTRRELEERQRAGEQERLRLEVEERQEREQEEEKQRLQRDANERTADQLKQLGAVRGDQRMCGCCQAGPYENQACPDLAHHNQ